LKNYNPFPNKYLRKPTHAKITQFSTKSAGSSNYRGTALGQGPKPGQANNQLTNELITEGKLLISLFQSRFGPNGYVSARSFFIVGYAARRQRQKAKNTRKRIWMHREIIHIPEHLVCDHINRNGLEWDKNQRKWKARIQLDVRKTYLDSFANEIDAAKVYDNAAKKYYGQFACLNFPPCPRSSSCPHKGG